MTNLYVFTGNVFKQFPHFVGWEREIYFVIPIAGRNKRGISIWFLINYLVFIRLEGMYILLVICGVLIVKENNGRNF